MDQRMGKRAMFPFALNLAVIDDEKACIIDTCLIDNREYLTVHTIAGDVFEIMRPAISEELEAEHMKQVRAIIAEEESNEP